MPGEFPSEHDKQPEDEPAELVFDDNFDSTTVFMTAAGLALFVMGSVAVKGVIKRRKKPD